MKIRLLLLALGCSVISAEATLADAAGQNETSWYHPEENGLSFGRAIAKDRKPKPPAKVRPVGRVPAIAKKRKVHPPNKAGDRIVGGMTAQPYQFPSIVTIHVNGKTECGGSIIKPNWVLTAAHCIEENPDPNVYTVTAAEYQRSVREGPEQNRKAVELILHEDFDSVKEFHDIGLIKVDPPFKFNDKVQPAKLPNKKGFPIEPMITVAGWGAMESGRSYGSDFLQFVYLSTITDLECQRKYKKYDILESQMCTLQSGGGKDACQGDSGGPAFSNLKNPVQVGIVAWGDQCAMPDNPGVYTEVSYYLDWIESNTADEK